MHTPPWFIGNLHATPQCLIADFSSNQCPVFQLRDEDSCPETSKVGSLEIADRVNLHFFAPHAGEAEERAILARG